jgi:hypothetical protein
LRRHIVKVADGSRRADGDVRSRRGSSECRNATDCAAANSSAEFRPVDMREWRGFDILRGEGVRVLRSADGS